MELLWEKALSTQHGVLRTFQSVRNGPCIGHALVPEHKLLGIHDGPGEVLDGGETIFSGAGDQ